MGQNKIDKEKEKSFDEIFYSEGLSAWYNTKLERDKSIFFVSAGALAVLLAFTGKVQELSFFCKIIFLISLLLFVYCVLKALEIFYTNAEHIRIIISNKENEKDRKASEKNLANKQDHLYKSLQCAIIVAGTLLVSIVLNDELQMVWNYIILSIESK